VAKRRPTTKLHVVLLAGGSGMRFWPLSRKARPKQFHALTGKRSLLVETWKRVRKLAPASRIWVVAPKALAASVRSELPALRADRLVPEPSPRDTGPAIGLACAMIAKQDPQGVAAVFPTDHVVRDTQRFVDAVQLAAREAAAGSLVCLGVRPNRPATGFGYLRCAKRPARGRAVDVSRFVEKPDLRKARRFLKDGGYLWNAGMFVWRVETFLTEMARTAPEMEAAVRGFAAGKSRMWSRAPRISVDYAVMERARHVRVVPLDAGWDDIGSWDAASLLLEQAGVASPDSILIDSDRSVVFGDDRVVALVDVPGVVVIDTKDALLVVSRENAERVREVIEELRRRRRKDLL
jgi:mannose-1-phosphate guanylyltransferase